VTSWKKNKFVVMFENGPKDKILQTNKEKKRCEVYLSGILHIDSLLTSVFLLTHSLSI